MKLKKTAVIIIIFLGIALLIFAILSIPRFLRSSQSNIIGVAPTLAVPTPQSATGFTRDPYMDQFAVKDAPPSSTPLTKEELVYPTGLPQKFRDTKTTETGTLVVTSDIPDVRIIITTKDPGDADISGDTQYYAPANGAPTRFILPVNYYTVIAQKERYIWKWIPIVIEPNKTTRLKVHLDPANLAN